ncbi:MAG: adenylate kinase [Gemmatimonadota bacterium]
MVVILLGPPGVGKGTQAAVLAQRPGWTHLSTGDLLREARRNGTELGTQAQAYMDAGQLVPDALILDLVQEKLGELPEGQHVLFDGFPRTLPQAEALGPVLGRLSRQVDRVLVLEAPAEVLVKRLSGRRTCGGCGRIYNIHFDPPAKEGVCDRCGASLTHRKDDREDTVAQRLEVYSRQTEPLIRYYEGSPAMLVRIQGDQPMEQVQADVKRGVEEAAA